jgi:hypothetical protein
MLDGGWAVRRDPVASPLDLGSGCMTRRLALLLALPFALVPAVRTHAGRQLVPGVVDGTYEYTPQILDLHNLDSVSVTRAIVSVNRGTVTVWIRATVHATITGAASYEVSLPIGKDLEHATDVIGDGSVLSGSTSYFPSVQVEADAATENALVRWWGLAAMDANQVVEFSYPLR